MKKLLLAFIATSALVGCSTPLDTIQTDTPNGINVKNYKTVCLFDYTPNIEYTSLKYYRSGRNLFGSVNSVMPKFVNYADRLDANTIINFEGGQRFGFWPWRFVRPVVYGTAVDWPTKSNESCKYLGGRVYAIINNKKVIDITNKI
ncbi:hypothetical protein ACFFLZ_05275 [Photobacterium aphoticum]|uniref:hypothetical protein n=1 Tax=Photobacterium aphoticum TaxID=754436 RepID=UPI000AE93EF1|nr:hypothetical protein [Photobacterium aphoticum]GHA32701.1 hypothetical protein GCM10007086_02370 [Photobacterium aphoticum]